MSDVLDIQRLVGKLDGLVAQARGSAGVDGEQLLKQARALLAKARDAPVVASPETAVGAGWHAVGGSNGGDITCWRDDVGASLYGAWEGGRLELVQLTVGEAVWGSRMTSVGASLIATEAEIEGPADRRLYERIKRETAAERHRVALQFATRSWTCLRCSWMNERNAKSCAFCGVVTPPWEPTVPSLTPTPAEPRAESVEADVIPEAEGQLTLEELRLDWPQGFGEQDAVTEVWGNIVLDGFDPDRKVSVVRAVIDAGERAGAGRLGLAEAKALVEHLPAIICRGVPAANAADIQRHLDEAGASTRFERGHD